MTNDPLVIVLLISVSGAWAQTDDSIGLTQLAGGYAVFVPEDCQIEEVEPGVFRLFNDEMVIRIYTPDMVGGEIGLTHKKSDENIFVTFFDDYYMPDVGSGEIVVEELDERTIIIWRFGTALWNRQTEGVKMLIDMGDRSFGALEARVPASEFEDFEELINDIAMSFDYSDEATPCFLSTSENGFAEVRVGPGSHRSVLTYLPADGEFEVLGQTEADGQTWWKLDVAEVAPSSGANEVWVADEHVSAVGGCNTVADADAPPVIFAPPSLPEGQDTPSASDQSVIASGSWTVVIGYPMPCNNWQLNWENLVPFGAEIFVTDEFIFGDIGFFVKNEYGDYIGSTVITIDNEDVPALVSLRVISETHISGYMSVSGHGCEFVHEINITKN